MSQSEKFRYRFHLGEAKRKLVALQNKVVSQHDGTTNLHDDRLEGKSLSNVLMVEIYAGSARLARACRHVGCRSVAVDKTTDRSHGTKIFVCDVTKPEELEMLKHKLRKIIWVGFTLHQRVGRHPRRGKNRIRPFRKQGLGCQNH